MDFNVAIVHNQIFGQEILQGKAIDDVKFAISLQSINHIINTLFKLSPILLVVLHLRLGHAQILIELLQVIMIVYLIEFILLSYLRQLTQYVLAEVGCLLGELFLHFKQVPILPHAA